MISDCSYCGYLELSAPGFFADVFELLVLVIPGAIFFTLWRIFVTNKAGPRGGVVVLGLDDSSSTYSDLKPAGISAYLRFCYCLTSVVTFGIGLLTSEAFKFLRNAVF